MQVFWVSLVIAFIGATFLGVPLIIQVLYESKDGGYSRVEKAIVFNTVCIDVITIQSPK